MTCNIRPPQSSKQKLLLLIYNDHIYIRDLAAQMNMHRHHVGKLTQRLRDAGLIERVKDGRVFKIRLTEAGFGVVSEMGVGE
jgi:DNA-binding MarR family transcriptional regulator